MDPKKISWTRALRKDLLKEKRYRHDSVYLVNSLYRPFTKQWLYFNKNLNEEVLQIPKFFPNKLNNKAICVTGVGAKNSFSAVMTDCVPDLQIQFNSQCFPLKLYESASETESNAPTDQPQGDLFSQPVAEPAADQPRYTVKDGISDAGLAHFQAAYPTETLSKEDLFYYIYGLLHSEDYKTRYADNLTKELPRIPAVKQAADFWAFSKAGRELAELHINYETQAPYPVTLDCGSRKLAELQDKDFYVTKMKFASKGDKSTVVYNHAITIKGIPLAAYDYVVNGKPALEWVMERQGVSTHKDSGIVNDANDWAIETMKNARYPLELFQRVITVSLRTMEIVRGLPGLGV